MSAAEAIVIDKPPPAQASFTATAGAPPTKEEFEHFHVDNAGGVPKVAGQQSAARNAGASVLDNPEVTARPAGEAPEPAVVLLVALGLVVIIRIRRQQTAAE
jgi:hypothetical protein